MATFNNPGSTSISTKKPEERADFWARNVAGAAGQAAMPTLRNASLGPIAGAQQSSHPSSLGSANMLNQAPGVTPLAPVAQSPAPQAPTALSSANMRSGSAPAAALATQLQSQTQQPAPQPVAQNSSLADANPYRNTSVNGIVGRVNANGVTEFSNAAADRQQAVGLGSLMPGGPTPTPAPSSLNSLTPGGPDQPTGNGSFASLGSANNLGNGVGTFSQMDPGTSQLALQRYERANQIRRDQANQSRLEDALTRQDLANRTTVVRDSSSAEGRRLAQADLRRDALTSQQLQANVDSAQGVIANEQTRQANDRQLQKTDRVARLEDAAMSAGATQEQRDAYRMAVDPSGALKAQAEAPQRAAELAKTQAETDKLRREVKPYALPATLQKLEDDDLQKLGTIDTMNSELSRIDQQIAEGKLELGPLRNQISKGLNAIGKSTENSANFASLNSTLEKLRNESLRLNSGVQTEGDAQRAWNEIVTNLNDPKIVRQRLAEIQQLNAKAAQLRTGIINSRRTSQGVRPLDVNSALGSSASQQEAAQQPAQAQTAPAQQPAMPRVESQAQAQALPPGTQFIGPDGNIYRT